ncbi:hypothetical protein FOA52_010494 [Chlamydomonas sp. UWO 241]|nr:hypothetical protein FOA52_010494 [Chlamydomonas sp. UWO 241]
MSLMQKSVVGRGVRPAVVARRGPVTVRASKDGFMSSIGQKAASVGAAALLSLSALSGAPAALASEFDVLAEAPPSAHYYVDDANVLSRATRSEIDKKLKLLDIQTGYRVTAVTVRKLEFEPDTYTFVDKVRRERGVLEGWYPSAEAGDKRGVVLVVTAAKEGAITGGKSFMGNLGDELLESLTVDNIPIYTEQERYNLCVTSVIDRIEAKLNDKEVPGAPLREEANTGRTYKTKEEVEKSKTVTSTVVATLLIIAVVVPMLQYYGYTARD